MLYPEPYEIGSVEKGKLLTSGNLKFHNELIKIPNHSLWEIQGTDVALDYYLHGFSWLNDLAAVGSYEALKLAQEWVFHWTLNELGNKNLCLDLLTQRLFNWINHSGFLLKTSNLALSDSYMKSIDQQSFFLEKRWQSLQKDVDRIKAIVLLISVGIYVTNKNYLVQSFIKALDKEIINTIDAKGGISSRDPNALAEIFSLLNWLEVLLEKINLNLSEIQVSAIKKIAPTLRSLRHLDGALIGFRGEIKIRDKYLDRALVQSGVKHRLLDRTVMGYSRLGNHKMSIFIDTGGKFDSITNGNFLHTKSAIEITINKSPFVVSGIKISNFRELDRLDNMQVDYASIAKLEKGFENNVSLQSSSLEFYDSKGATTLKTSHNGYLNETGLTHTRTIKLDNDETEIHGEDSFNANSDEAKFRFENILTKRKQKMFMSVHFLLHPEVVIEQAHASVNFLLENKESYSLKFSGKCDLRIEEGVFYEGSTEKSRATKQIVLSSQVVNYDNYINWRIVKV